MIDIEESDFRPLDEFTLKWRWTDSRWNKLPADALNSIQPRTESKARALCQYSLAFEAQFGLVESLFENIVRINTSGDDVAVFPLSGEWMLSYSHDEYFMFGEGRIGGAA